VNVAFSLLACWIMILLSLVIITYVLYVQTSLEDGQAELFREIDWRLL
jgi:hypothetical protein